MRSFFTIVLLLLSTYVFGQTGQITWKTFKHKNSYKIELPTFYTDGGYTNSGIHYFRNSNNEDVQCWVEGMGDGTSAALTNAYLAAAGDKSVTYKVFKPTWYVVSGKNEDGSYYYHKTILSKGNIFYLKITYAETEKSLFDIILPRIVKSFQALP